jgi:anti-repressor protein
MNVQIFENQNFGKIRTVLHNNELSFVAIDVCDALTINRTQTRRLDDDEKGVRLIQTPGGKQKLSVVNEFGLYNLILTSRKPQAKAFKRWITHEVIPSIRKTGQYQMPKQLPLIKEPSKRLLVDAPMNPELQKHIRRLEPKLIALSEVLKYYNRCNTPERSAGYSAALIDLSLDITVGISNLTKIKLNLIPAPAGY